MACRQLMRGHDLGCEPSKMKYFQQIILINKDDVEKVRYFNNDNHDHGVLFKLFNNAEGFLFRGSDKVSNYSAEFSKVEKKGRPYYNHTVNLVVTGVTQNTKLVLKQLDNSQYFACIQFMDGTIEIYGLQNGLKTNGYTYGAQNGMGGTVITLESRKPELEIPWVYLGDVNDFNSRFGGIQDVASKAVSNDFMSVQASFGGGL